MPISVKCPKCGSVLEAPDGSEGQEAECPDCNSTISIPAKKIIIKSKIPPSSISPAPPVPSVPTNAQIPPAIAPTSSVAPASPQTSGMAIASLVLGIIGLMGGFFCCGPIFPGLAVLFGHLGLSKTNRNPNLYSGRGFAIAGLILGYIGLVFWLIVTIAMHGAMAGMEMAMEQMYKSMGLRK